MKKYTEGRFSKTKKVEGFLDMRGAIATLNRGRTSSASPLKEVS